MKSMDLESFGVPKILMVGCVPDCSAISCLRQLSYDGRIQLVCVPGGVTSSLQPLVKSCDALLCVPGGCPDITDRQLRGVHKPFVIATISCEHNHICTLNEHFEVITASTRDDRIKAELALQLANGLFSQIHVASNVVASGDFRSSSCPDRKRLAGGNWCIIGRGSQVNRLVSMLMPWDLETITVCHPDMTSEVLAECLQGVYGLGWMDAQQGSFSENMSLEFQMNDALVRLVGEASLLCGVSEADIVSVHLPLVKDACVANPRTLGIIDEKLISRMKPGAALISVSSGDIIDESAVVNAVQAGKILYAADDICRKAVASMDPHDSSIWQENIRQRKEAAIDTTFVPSVILTPNISTFTDGDVEAMATEVIDKLLQSLNVI